MIEYFQKMTRRPRNKRRRDSSRSTSPSRLALLKI